MAVLSHMPLLPAIRDATGVMDFYKWKGLNVARKWPRMPKQPNTLNQQLTRTIFAAARTDPVANSTEARLLTQTLPTRPHGSRGGYVNTITLRTMYAKQPFHPIYPYTVRVRTIPPNPGKYVSLYYVKQSVFDPNTTSFFVATPQQLLHLVNWEVYQPLKTIGKLPKPQSRFPPPSLDLYRPLRVNFSCREHVELYVDPDLAGGTILAYFMTPDGTQHLLWRLPLDDWREELEPPEEPVFHGIHDAETQVNYNHANTLVQYAWPDTPDHGGPQWDVHYATANKNICLGVDQKLKVHVTLYWPEVPLEYTWFNLYFGDQSLFVDNTAFPDTGNMRTDEYDLESSVTLDGWIELGTSGQFAPTHGSVSASFTTSYEIVPV